MTTNTLKKMPYAQARVIIDDNQEIVLVSYVTPVAYIDADGWLTIGGLYSNTTRRHIGAFMQEYCNSTYQLARQIYEENLTYNIYTGEVKDL